LILAYINYLLKAGNRHSIHSPFVFELYSRVIRDSAEDGAEDYQALRLLRKELLASRRPVEILDLGAGSRVNRSNRREVRQIARNAEKPEKFGRLFYRLVSHLKPVSVLELGTSLGLTTLYFAKASPGMRVVTLEGCPETARLALQHFDRLRAGNIRVITGNIDDTLLPALAEAGSPLGIVYFDANHRYEPTMRYFQECLPFVGNESLFIFDDIYWSAGMTQAWEEIKRHPMVTVTIDLFWIGLVFFRKEQVKEDFVLRF